MSATFQKLVINIDLLRQLSEARFDDDLTAFDALPPLSEIAVARQDLVEKVAAGRQKGDSWYDSSLQADQDRLLKAVSEILLFLQQAREVAISSDVDCMYPDKESFYQHARFVLIGKDNWTQRIIPQREELERLYQAFLNSKAAEGLAIGRWHDTSHTGTAAALGLLTEYTPGGILDTEVWGQSFNDAFLLGAIKGARPVKLVTVLATHSRKEVEASSGVIKGCDVRNDTVKFDGHSISYTMINWTVQEARALKTFGFYASPHVSRGIEFLPLASKLYQEAREKCSMLDLLLLARQTMLMQALDNIMGRTDLQARILDFITPAISDRKIYIALHKRYIAGLQKGGVPESDSANTLIRRVDLRIRQASENLRRFAQPSETLLLRTAQDVSNSVRFGAAKLLAERYPASSENVATDNIVLAHLVLDKLVAQAVWNGALNEFRLNTYKAVESYVKNELDHAIDDPSLRRVREEAAGKRDDFFRAVQTGVYRGQTLTGPKFEMDEAPLLFSTYLQRVGFRIAQAHGDDPAEEVTDAFVTEFLNRHQYIPVEY